MQVKILKDGKIAIGGFNVITAKEGDVIAVNDKAEAQSLVKAGIAELVVKADTREKKVVTPDIKESDAAKAAAEAAKKKAGQ